MYAETSDLFRALLPRDCSDGWLAMLRPHFDDSGTHTGGKTGPSKIVLVAGIFGTEARLEALDRNWRKIIADPIDNGSRPSLQRFHAYDCDNSIGEFLGWSRTETDFLTHRLRTAIIESGAAAYGIGIARQDWDDLVTGDMRGFLGDAEAYCISQCFVRTLRWAQEKTFDPQITFVFDNRTPEVERRAKVISDAFERHTKQPEIVGTAFLSSHKVALLQAADLLAWELYHHANDILKVGLIFPRRAQMNHLTKNMDFVAQIGRRSHIAQLVNYMKKENSPDRLRQMAHHFTCFDPSNPDYSHLSELPPYETPSQNPSDHPKRQPRAPSRRTARASRHR